jgi:alpha-methylacyl-CoA racemase
VLTLSEAPSHPHIAARETYVEINDVVQPAPAPRFSRTESSIRSVTPDPVELREIVSSWQLNAGANPLGLGLV